MPLSVQFTGGIGNNLFQLFSAISLAAKHNTYTKFAPNSYVPKLLNPGIFQDPSNATNPDDTVELWENDLSQLGNYLSQKKHIRLNGTFQFYREFDEHAPIIANITGLFQKRRENEIKFRDLIYADSFNKTVISLHVRRGDYVPKKCYHLLLQSYYYKNAMLNIIGRLPSTQQIRVVCFYESSAREDVDGIVRDLTVMLANIGCANRVEFTHFTDMVSASHPNVEDYEEILAMSLCDHHIIANSTFSWWGAYLAWISMQKKDQQNKIVCYPSEFYGHQLYYLDVNGLFVDGWTRITAWDYANDRKCEHM